MSKKLVKCKSCGAEIAKTAKTCPQCGAKQHQAALSVCVVIIVIAVFLCIGTVASGGSGDEPHKVTGGDATVSSSDATSSVATTETTAPKNTAFTVGDKVELNGIVVTLVDITENTGANYTTPSDGKVFVLCEFEIENNSSKDIAVSSIMSFETYVDDYTTNMSLSALLTTDKTQLDGSVAAGKKMNGVIGYEVSSDWSTIEIRFTPDFWAGKDITFTYTK